MDDKKDFHYTPTNLAIKLINIVDIESNDVLLEPFKGGGSFYDNFPEQNPKDWCEIDDGKDFF